MSYDRIALTRPPLTRLPPELLALVFESLDKEERILCMMSHWHWRALIKGLWPNLKIYSDGLLLWAAEIGNKLLMEYAKVWGAINFTWALNCAAENGHIDCLKLLKKWGADDFNNALKTAAGKGHIKVMKLLKKWGAFDFPWPLLQAATGGHIDCMKLLKEWGSIPGGNELSLITAGDINSTLRRAAHGGHIDCMKLLKKWGAFHFNKALWSAAYEGHIDCMKLLKEWGATNFNWALEGAADGARRFTYTTLETAENERQEITIALLKTWIKEQDEG